MRQVTNDAARDRAPHWSPDGRRIFFYSDRHEHSEVWSIDADGGALQQLTRTSFMGYPIPSRDGTRLAAADQNPRKMFIFDTHDFSKPLDTLPPFLDMTVLFPRPTDWSPDGRQLAIFGIGGTGGLGLNGGVWVYSLEGRTYRRIGDGGNPRWLNDGRRLVYQNRGRLHVADVTTGATRELLAVAGENLGLPHPAANDSQLFFTRGTSAGDIWVVRFGDK